MVFSGAGSAAPRVGTPYPSAANQISPGRAAAALVGAGVISAAAASGLASEGRTFENNYQRPPEMTRSAPVPSTGSSNPFLEGATGQSAPRIPSSMPSMPSASYGMPGASGGMPPIKGGSGLAGAAAALGSAALEKGMGGLGDAGAKGNDPLSQFRRALGNAQQLESQRKADEQAAMGGFWKDLGDEWKKRTGKQRKGDKMPGPSTPPGENQPPPQGTAGVAYQVTYTFKLKVQADPITATKVVTAPFSIQSSPFGDGKGYSLVGATNSFGIVAGGDEDIEQKPAIVSANRVDGNPEPNQPQTNPFDPTNKQGLFPEPTFPDSPLLAIPSDATPSPARANKPIQGSQPTTGSPASSSTRPPNPSNPPSVDPAAPGQPTNPAAMPPSPSAPGASLPGIPSAPATGTATTTNPSFPSSFTQPGVRNPEALKPFEPSKPDPQQKPGCDDPCIQELLDNADQKKKDDKEKEPEEIKVKVFSRCSVAADNTSDNAIFEDKTIKVPKEESENYQLLYERIASLEALQCNPIDAIASIPEWWQVRPGANRPQLVIFYGDVQPNGKIGRKRYALTLPHYNKPQPFKPNFPIYRKGQWEAILTLADNSKLIVNAISQVEATMVINSLKTFINPEQTEGSFIKVGERKGQDLLKIQVVPVLARFFATGQKDTNPDWVKDLRK